MHLDLTAEEAALFFGCCAALSTMRAFGYRRVSTVRGARAISLRHNKNQAPAASNDVRIIRAAIRPRRSTIRASVGRRLIVCRRRQGPKKPNWHPSRHSPSARAHCGFLLTSADDLVKSSGQSRNAFTAMLLPRTGDPTPPLAPSHARLSPTPKVGSVSG
jgi:hypothetical protein